MIIRILKQKFDRNSLDWRKKELVLPICCLSVPAEMCRHNRDSFHTIARISIMQIMCIFENVLKGKMYPFQTLCSWPLGRGSIERADVSAPPAHRPIIDYLINMCKVWNPHLEQYILSLEKEQKFNLLCGYAIKRIMSHMKSCWISSRFHNFRARDYNIFVIMYFSLYSE